jgi:hypothetical protein
MSENRMLWRVFGLKRREVAGVCGGLHNEELRGLYTSPGVVGVIESRRIK